MLPFEKKVPFDQSRAKSITFISTRISFLKMVPWAASARSDWVLGPAYLPNQISPEPTPKTAPISKGNWRRRKSIMGTLYLKQTPPLPVSWLHEIQGPYSMFNPCWNRDVRCRPLILNLRLLGGEVSMNQTQGNSDKMECLLSHMKAIFCEPWS